MRTTIAVATVLAAILVPAATASAHVTVQPNAAPAGGFTRLDVRVPNERDDAGTTKVEVKFPPGFASASTEPVPGWTAKVAKRGDQVDTITWTGDGRTGIVKPGEFQDFGLSLATPDKPGSKLTFKALQTYSNGEVVRWIGPPDADEPAPQVTLTSAQAQAPAATQQGDDDTGAPVWLAVAALALGALGLAAGAAGLARARRAAIR
jgi:periplasmic copper chaperone A